MSSSVAVETNTAAPVFLGLDSSPRFVTRLPVLAEEMCNMEQDLRGQDP